MDTFLPPVEEPRGLIMRLAYYFTRKQFGKVLTPLKVHSARLPAAFGLFYSKIGTLDKKLTLAPEMVMLIREQVARLNVCLFCMDIGAVDRDPGVHERSEVRCAGELPDESALYRSGTRGAGLCDGIDDDEKGRSRHVRAAGASLV